MADSRRCAAISSILTSCVFADDALAAHTSHLTSRRTVTLECFKHSSRGRVARTQTQVRDFLTRRERRLGNARGLALVWVAPFCTISVRAAYSGCFGLAR